MRTRASLKLVGMVGALCLVACGSDGGDTDTGTTNPGNGGQAGKAGSGASSGMSGSSGQAGTGLGGAAQGGSAGAPAGQAGVGQAGVGQGGGSGGTPSGGQGGQGTGAGGQGQGGASTAGQGGASTAGTSGQAGFGASAGQGTGGKPPVEECSTAEGCAGFTSTPGQGEPPPATPGAGPAEGASVVYAFDRIFLGETDREGNVSEQAWKKFGFNQDGWTSTPGQGFHCKPIGDAKNADIRQDGDGGIDNSFGKNFVNGILSIILATPSDSASEVFLNGSGSFLIDVAALGAQSSYASLMGGLGRAEGMKTGDQFVSPPANDWSGYEWHPLTGTRTAFGEAYLANNILVSRFNAPVQMNLLMGGTPVDFPLLGASLVMDVSDRSRGELGTLGGIIPTEALTTAMQKVAGSLDTKFCDPNSPALTGILDGVRGASDILQDGTQDPTKDCNAISMGWGFTARATKVGAPVALQPAPDPCTN